MFKEFGKLVNSCTKEGNNRTKRNIGFMNFQKSIYSEFQKSVYFDKLMWSRLNTKKSALSQHVMDFDHRIDWDNVKILKSESHAYRRCVVESF